MRTLRSQLPVVALTVVVAVLATLLTVDVVRGDRGIAFGQVSEGAMANYVIGLLGEQKNDLRPLFLVDTKSQTIMIYEYLDSRRVLIFRAARSYASDREVADASFYDRTNVYTGPSVRDIQQFLREGARPVPGR
jgi:hypothetical protein